jgi:hypothetical protein
MARARCDSLLMPSGKEAADLRGLLEDPDIETDELLDETHWCELEIDHPGPHLALGQTDGRDRDWWVSWTTEITRMKPCQSIERGDDTRCRLPLGHAGGHSFALAGLPGQFPPVGAPSFESHLPHQGR